MLTHDPTVTNAKALMQLPTRAKLRKDNEEPMETESTTEREPPILPNLRTLRALPTMPLSRMDRFVKDPMRHNPTIEIEEPILVKLLMLRELPTLMPSNTEIADPNRAKLLTDMADPMDPAP
jgi:hypothetical protein